MIIIERKETLMLTQNEKAILAKATAILEEIFDKCETGGEIKTLSNLAKDSLNDLLADAIVQGGEPKGAINVTILM